MHKQKPISQLDVLKQVVGEVKDGIIICKGTKKALLIKIEPLGLLCIPREVLYMMFSFATFLFFGFILSPDLSLSSEDSDKAVLSGFR